MSDILRAIVLGIVQGLTEFLPVSSSGHLEIFKYLLNDQSLAEESLLMTVVLHAATALSTLVVFRKEVYHLITGLLQFTWNEETRYCFMIAISMIPAVIVGLLFEDQMALLFDKQILLVAAMLLVTAGLLYFAEVAMNKGKSVTNLRAFGIGLAQAIAILPGISRSGATISASLLMGIDREKAARFSFLMVVPLILGKMAKDLLSGDLSSNSASSSTLLFGFLAAFVTGYFACTWMIKLVKNSQLRYFSLYCIFAALFAVFLYFYRY